MEQVTRRIQVGGLALSLVGCKRARAPEGVRTHAPIVVGSDFRPKMTRYVLPVYPEWARKAHIEGTLEYAVTIGKDGEVRDLSLVSGPDRWLPLQRPLFVGAGTSLRG
jgi:outer membrane biosynthesis protein TonB